MTFNSLSTSLRIKKRMFLFYVDQFSDPFIWVARLFVNYAFFLTSPIWIGFAYLLLASREAWQNKKSAERKCLTGDIWFWEQFSLY